MTFLHVALLGGAALVTVPIILHLIMRQQPRHLEFPALRFIKLRDDANRRRLKLRHLLLLLLRCAAIAVLALALARPSILTSGVLGSRESPVAAALVFDTSLRMQYKHQNQTRLESARETALWLVGQLPADSEVAVVDSQTHSAVFSVDMGAAKQRIGRLDHTTSPLPLASIVEDAYRLVGESEKQRKEVYIFTDLAKANWNTPAAQALAKRLQAKSDVGTYVIDVGVKEPRNFALAELQLSAQTLSKNTPLRVQTDLLHVGPAGDRTVELYLEDTPGKPERKNQRTFTLGAGESAHVDLAAGSLSEGVHQGYVKIAGEDGLSCDDVRFFTVEVKPSWRVLVAAPAKAEDYASFLTEALAPYEYRIKGEAAFQCEVAPLEELAKRDLTPYAAVCVLDPAPLSAEAWHQLNNYAIGGGGLAIFLGHNAQPSGQPVDAFNSPTAQQVMPGKLLRQHHAGEREIYLSPDNLEHPLLARFRPLESSVPWDGFPVFTHWELGPLAAGSGIVIPFSDNLPALIERPLGKGRALVMTTPISDPASPIGRETWNILPTGDEPWPFVLLANETLRYLVGSSETRLNYRAGDTAVLHLDPAQEHPLFAMRTPRGDLLRQSADEKQHALILSTTDSPGNYRVAAGGKDDKVDLGFSVNLSPELSQLERIDDEGLHAVLGDLPYRLAHNREEIDRSISIGREGRELFPLLIVLVALLLAGEQVLSNRFYRNSDKTGRRGADKRRRWSRSELTGEPAKAAVETP